jgi:hypothetical protein
MGRSNIPGFKVIPLQRNLKADMALLPYHKIEEDIRSAGSCSIDHILTNDIPDLNNFYRS